MELEKRVLKELDAQFDVQDVYFCKGVLYCINSYDIPVIEEYLAAMHLDLVVKYVEEEPSMSAW